jgi:hypothetical protein
VVVGVTDDRRERTARARINDETHPELFEAFEEAVEARSMAAVVREALRSDLLDGEEEDVDGLTGPARKGLRTLRDHVSGRSGDVEVGVAETIVASATNIKKEDLKSAVFAPLRREGYINVSSRTQAAYIVVLPPGAQEMDEAEVSGTESDRWTARSPTPEEKAQRYERAGLEPPEELVAEADGGEVRAE